MKGLYICVISFVILISQGFGQATKQGKLHQVYLQSDFLSVEHYNSTLEANRPSFGIAVASEWDLLSSSQFHLGWRLGYRHVSKYAHANAIGFAAVGQVLEGFYNYNGGWTGFNINWGKRFTFEASVLLGLGAMTRTNPSNTNLEAEASIEAGLKQAFASGLTFRAGGKVHTGRNGFFRDMYGAYLSAGYVFNQRDYYSAKPERTDRFMSIGVAPYILSVTEDLIGLGMHFDHFLVNTASTSFGYTVGVNLGLIYEGDVQPSIHAGVLGLVGPRSGKLELGAGINAPLAYGPFDFLSAYELTFLSIGYRRSFNDLGIPIAFRIGSATTSALYVGLAVEIR